MKTADRLLREHLNGCPCCGVYLPTRGHLLSEYDYMVKTTSNRVPTTRERATIIDLRQRIDGSTVTKGNGNDW
jgi:hypothetical protein